MYKNYNNNPKNKKTEDCVIRAFALATNKTWDKVYRELFELSFETKLMLNGKQCYTKYAEQVGLKARKIVLKNGHKPTVNSFANDNPKGRFVLRVANHLVTVVDGDYYDIWDCGYKSVYMYWEVV